VIALSLHYPWGFASLLAPVFMYWILVYVTGIPPLEEQMLCSRGDLYRAYQLRTSKFFPLPQAHDPEESAAVFPRDKSGTRLRGDHAQTKKEVAP